MKAMSFTLFITLYFAVSFMMYGNDTYNINLVCNSYMSGDGYESLE